jgi:hypothetical protein
MKTSMLAATAAIALIATPAHAGGDLLGGVTGAVTNTVGGLGAGGAGDCLCETVKGALGQAGSSGSLVNGAIGKTGSAGSLVNSVGRLGHGGGSSGGKSVGLAGTISNATDATL